MTRPGLRDRLYGLFLLVCVASLGWPIYPLLGARIEPFILGVPFSLAWMIGWVVLSFLALLAYDRAGGR
jgi:hypothetical protein